MVEVVLAGHVRGHIREHDVRLANLFFQLRANLLVGEVATNGFDTLQRLNPLAVDAHHASGADALGGDLEPATGGSPEVDHGVAVREEVGGLVELLELVGRPGTIALLFRLVVVLVSAAHVLPSEPGTLVDPGSRVLGSQLVPVTMFATVVRSNSCSPFGISG